MTKAEISALIAETVQATVWTTVEALFPAKPKEPAAPIRRAPEHNPMNDVPGIIWIRPMSRPPSPPRQLTDLERVQKSFEFQRSVGGILAQWRIRR